MDVVTALGGIGAAFGLATSAGLNAYIPLLLVALAARFPTADPLLNLSDPYNILANGWVILLLAVLLLVEMFVDKVPALDTVNDIIQTFVRPAAGAFLFAANANIITDASPVLSIIAGLIMAGSVHATKGAVRPAITATTAGTGNWLVSLLEDVVAVILSILSILIPVFVILVLVIMLLVFVRFLRRRKKPVVYP